MDESKGGRPAARPGVWLILWALLVLTAGLGSRGLNEPDEGRYAEIGREMAAGGSWVLPHLNGFPHFQKPPLVYWMTATGFRVFGINEWGARFPSAAAAFGTLLVTWMIGRRLWDARVATTAALVLLGGLEFFGLARMLTPDMLMTFWITAAIGCLVRAVTDGSSPESRGFSPWIWGFFACQGMGFMTKGPMALVVPSGAALGWWWCARKTAAPIRIPWIRGVTIALALGLAWFVVITIRIPVLLDYFVGDELVKRVASKAHGRSKPFWFFVPVLIGGALPWTAFAPWIAGVTWNRWRAGSPLLPWQGLLLGWTVIPFAVLSISGSKLLTYVLPLYPALAITVAVAWHRHSDRPAARRSWWGSWAVLACFTLALIVLRFTSWGSGIIAWPLGGILLFGGWIAGERWRRPSAVDLPRLAIVASSTWVVVALQLPGLNRFLGRQASIRELAETASRFAGPDGAVFSYDVRACGFGFYQRRLIGIRASEADLVLPPTPEESRRLIESSEDAARLAPEGRPVCGLIMGDQWGRAFAEPDWRLLGRAGEFALVGRTAPPGPRR